jgi:hypothetical protein
MTVACFLHERCIDRSLWCGMFIQPSLYMVLFCTIYSAKLIYKEITIRNGECLDYLIILYTRIRSYPIHRAAAPAVIVPASKQVHAVGNGQ